MMKKSLIALAALAATSAFAQSSVSIDGGFDAGLQMNNYKGNKVSGIAGNGSSTSQFNLRGTEDLGSGLKANFRLETDFNAVSNLGNTGTSTGSNATTPASSINGAGGTFGNGEIRVGLSGNFGAVDMGAVNYNSLTTTGTGQPFGTAIGSGFRTFFINDAQATSAVRAENAIKYMSPDFMGLKASVYVSKKQALAANGTTSTTTGLTPQANAFSTTMGAYDQVGTSELGLNYANGPLAASFSQLKQNAQGIAATNSSGAAAATTIATVNTLGANYALGNAKVFALYQNNKTNTSSVNSNAFSVSGTYTMGAFVMMAQLGRFNNKVASTSSNLVGIGIDYMLSKRTALYLRAESINGLGGSVQAAASPAAINGTDLAKFSRNAIGLRHAF